MWAISWYTIFWVPEPPPPPGKALEGKGPQRWPWRRLPKQLGGGYWRLQMPLELALAVRGTVARHRLGGLERVGDGMSRRGGTSPPSNASLPPPRLLFYYIPGRGGGGVKMVHPTPGSKRGFCDQRHAVDQVNLPASRMVYFCKVIPPPS